MTETRTATARRSAASARGSTAPRERPDRAAAGSWPVRERSLIGPVLGIPPLVAVALAVCLTAVGVGVDLLRVGTVATIFQIAYGAGCLLAVAWVRRRSIFLPAIQPPLLLAVVVPVLAVLVGEPSTTAGVTEHLLLAGAPLINAFPAMAVTTGLVLLLAGFRLVRQRTGPDDAIGLLRARLSGRRDGGGEAAGGRSAGPDAAGGRGGRDGGAARAGSGRTGAGRTATGRTGDRATGRTGERAADRATGRAGDGTTGTTGRTGDRASNRASDRPSARSTDRGSERGSDRKPSARRSSPGEQGSGRDRTPSARTRTDARDDSRRDSSREGGRPSGSRDRARLDDGPPDADRRTPRGSASRGGSRGGRPRGSGGSPEERARSRRPRPSDPT